MNNPHISPKRSKNASEVSNVIPNLLKRFGSSNTNSLTVTQSVRVRSERRAGTVPLKLFASSDAILEVESSPRMAHSTIDPTEEEDSDYEKKVPEDVVNKFRKMTVKVTNKMKEAPSNQFKKIKKVDLVASLFGSEDRSVNEIDPKKDFSTLVLTPDMFAELTKFEALLKSARIQIYDELLAYTTSPLKTPEKLRFISSPRPNEAMINNRISHDKISLEHGVGVYKEDASAVLLKMGMYEEKAIKILSDFSPKQENDSMIKSGLFTVLSSLAVLLSIFIWTTALIVTLSNSIGTRWRTITVWKVRQAVVFDEEPPEFDPDQHFTEPDVKEENSNLTKENDKKPPPKPLPKPTIKISK
jgi:hypothetical protein